jgi:hypothetical protein
MAARLRQRGTHRRSTRRSPHRRMAFGRRPGWRLTAFLNSDLTPPERAVTHVEGWILGVPSLVRAEQRRGAPTQLKASAAICLPSLVSLTHTLTRALTVSHRG